VKINWMIGRVATLLLTAFTAVLLTSCGSGAVSSSSDPTLTFAVSPSTATAYSGVPATFIISGGGARSPYQVTSSNTSLLPVPASPIAETQFVVTPAAVSAQQSITISVMDQAGKIATASVTIQPNLIGGDISITGTAPADFPNCAGAGAVCAGQSGTATLTVSQNGSGARGRSVRFDVVQGAFRFPVDVAQTVFANTVTVTSDETGHASTVLRANVGASPQIATIRATDTATGAFRTATFFIKQPTVNGGEFVTIPPEWKVTGTYKTACPGGSVDYLIFGGTPPYTIRSSAPSITSAVPAQTAVENPSRFTVSFAAIGVAGPGNPTPPPCSSTGYQVLFTVTDATGLSIQPILTVTPGTSDAPTAPPTITLSPQSVTLACNQSAQVLATITNPGATAPTITASIATPFTASALSIPAPITNGVITIIRANTGDVGSVAYPGPSPYPLVTATVTVGAGSATAQTITVSTPYRCP
jgi:hypothetical protein